MNLYRKARLAPWSRAEIVHRILDLQQSAATVAAAFSVSTRPTNALACAGLDENPGICLTHPLDPAQPGLESISIAWAHNWHWQPLAGDFPTAGIIAAAGEFHYGQQWWLVATDGLYRSKDAGKTLEKVLDEKGSAVSRKGGDDEEVKTGKGPR